MSDALSAPLDLDQLFYALMHKRSEFRSMLGTAWPTELQLGYINGLTIAIEMACKATGGTMHDFLLTGEPEEWVCQRCGHEGWE